MKPPIPVIYNGDSYLFHLADDDSVSSIEFFANNQSVVAEPRTWEELDVELHRLFKEQLKRRQRT